MEFQKIINLLHNTANQPSEDKKKLAEIKDDSLVTYDTNIQIKFKNTMLKATLCEQWCIHSCRGNYNSCKHWSHSCWNKKYKWKSAF